MKTSFAAAILVAYAQAHGADDMHLDDYMKPYSRDYYAAHACEHAVWDL